MDRKFAIYAIHRRLNGKARKMKDNKIDQDSVCNLMTFEDAIQDLDRSVYKHVKKLTVAMV